MGAGLPRFLKVPGENLPGVYCANEYLTRTNLMKAYDFPVHDTPIRHGKNVVVFGGGNVAMDAARTASASGRRERDPGVPPYRAEMPARLAEVHHAKEEGVKILELANPLEFIKGEDGFVSSVKLERMELGEPDESGRRRPVPVADSAFEIPCDVAITPSAPWRTRLPSSAPMSSSTAGASSSRRGRPHLQPQGVGRR